MLARKGFVDSSFSENSQYLIDGRTSQSIKKANQIFLTLRLDQAVSFRPYLRIR